MKWDGGAMPAPLVVSSRRVAACVAACAGIDTRALERGALTDLFRAVTALCTQAEPAAPGEVVVPAALLAALADILDQLGVTA